MNAETFKTLPYEHQWQTLERMWNWKAYALLWEMGTGKSKLVLDNAAWLHRAGKITRLLILAPKGVYSNWAAREIPTHLPDWCERLVVKWRALHTSGWLQEWIALSSPANVGRLKVVVMNIEALSTRKGFKFAHEFCGAGQTMCVVDESTSIKNYTAARAKAACQLGELCEFRRILTGTPTPRDPLDLWAQFRFLSGSGGHLLGHSTWFSFRERYAKVVKVRLGNRAPFPMVVGWRNQDELATRLAEYSSRVRKEECLDLPPKVYQIREVEATTEQVRVYQEMAEDLMTYIGGERIDVTLTLVKLQKLQQIMAGFLIDNEGTVHELPHNRLDALVEVIEEIDPSEPVIIWAHYRAAIEQIAARLRKEYPADVAATYFGDTSEDDRELAVEQFQAGQVRFFIGNPQTAGYGLTLTRGSHVIYYSRGYDWAQRSQSEDRCHRIGQEKKVLYLDLLTPGSIEVDILEALRAKMTLTAGLLREKVPDWIGPLARRSTPSASESTGASSSP